MSYLLSIWGTVNSPYNGYQSFEQGGLAEFIANIIKLIIVVAGLYTVFNFVFAGFTYLSAGGDPKKVAQASSQIWQSIIGLVIVVSAFVIAAIISNILFGDPTTIFDINIVGPGSSTGGGQ
jgi:flagellar biosynthesis protein FlhB